MYLCVMKILRNYILYLYNYIDTTQIVQNTLWIEEWKFNIRLSSNILHILKVISFAL